ncbi:MAG: hypothetical protein ACR2ME_02775 [Acidimicrobiia bacterium]
MNRYKRRRSSITATETAMAAAIRGCVCRPEISRRHKDGIGHLDMYHDGDCPAADSGTQLLIGRGHQTAEEFAAVVAEVVEVFEEGRGL